MRRPTLRHRIEYLGFRLALGILRSLPERPALWIGETAGWFTGIVLGIRRRVVREHLRFAFPGENEASRRRLAAASFRHLGREAVATFLVGGMTTKEILERTEIGRLDLLRDALAQGEGAVLLTAHFGNWEIAGAALALRGIPMDVVAQRQRNPLFDSHLNEGRRRMGMRVIPRNEAPRRILRSLRDARAVAFVGDQNVRKGGVFVTFFGKQASTARGPSVFALRTGCPIFQGVNRRLGGYPTRYHLEIVPVDFEPTGDLEADVQRLTQRHADFLEAEIRETPEQYFWQHRRWKTRPRGE